MPRLWSRGGNPPLTEVRVSLSLKHTECDKIVGCLSLQSASLKTDDRCHVGPTAVRNMCVCVSVCGTVYQPQPLSCYLFLCPLSTGPAVMDDSEGHITLHCCCCYPDTGCESPQKQLLS